MGEPIIFVGLDLHKDASTMALADEGRRGAFASVSPVWVGSSCPLPGIPAPEEIPPARGKSSCPSHLEPEPLALRRQLREGDGGLFVVRAVAGILFHSVFQSS